MEARNSNFSNYILESLKCDPLACAGVEYVITTYLGIKQKSFRKVVLEVELVLGGTRLPPLLIDRKFDIFFGQVIENLKDLGYSLASVIKSKFN